MSHTLVVGLIAQLRCHQLLSPAQLDELERVMVPACTAVSELAEHLVTRRLLTPFQAEQLVQGRDLVLDDYVLLDKLGEGGMGVVFKARHRLMRREVALKLVHPERLARPQLRERFLREIHTFGQLSHPNIVTAFDAGQVGDRCFLVMELLDGMDLAKVVQTQGPLPIEAACGFARQAALGLAHAHQRGVVHRDVKPSNLIRTQDEVIKILDLGLAHLCAEGEGSTVDPLTPAGIVMGTPDFIAPEQAVDAQRADSRSDVYSLGCTLYCLLTGSVPFPGGSAAGKMLRHQTDTPAPLEERRPDVPASVAVIVRKLMARPPEERFQTAAEVADALASLESLPGTGASQSLIQTAAAAPTSVPVAKVQQHPPASTATAQTQPLPWLWRFVLPGLLLALCLLAVASMLLGWLNGRPDGREKKRDPDPAAAEVPAELPPGLLHWKRHRDWVKAVAFLPPQGQTVISGGGDGLRLWNVQQGAELPGSPLKVGNIFQLAVAPDGSRLAMGTQNPPTTLVLWEESAGVQPTAPPAPAPPVRALAFSPNGGRLAAVGFDNRVHVYETSRRQHMHCFEVSGGDVLGLYYLPRGNQIRTARKDAGPAFGPGLTIQLWDVEKGEEIDRKQFRMKETSCTAFSPEGERVLAAAGDHSLVLWDIGTGKEVIQLHGHTAPLRSLAISPDGSRALSGGGEYSAANLPQDCTVRLWDLKTGKEVYRSDTLEAPVSCVQFSPDNRIAAAGTDNKRLYLWRLPLPR
jgi:serine/threonine-protein kinase